MAHPGGRPPHFKTDQELQDKIQEYFDSGCNTKEIYIKVGKDEFEPREMKIPTITGLTLFLGFADRRSFYDYENNEEFSHTIKRARTLIEQEYEEMLRTNPTGAIFALKNFNRTDKQEISQTTTNLNLNKDVSELSDEELLAYIKS